MTIAGRLAGLDFSGATLQEMVAIHALNQAGGRISFESTVARHEIRLSGSVSQLVFDAKTNLAGGISGKVKFEQEVSFCGDHGPVEFPGSEFPSALSFEGRMLRIRLDGSSIGGALQLRRLVCTKDASFRNCHLSGDVDLDGAAIGGTLDMSSSSNAVIAGRTTFKKTSLFAAKFDGRTFSDSTDFADCRFLHAPSFRGCSLHTETVLPRTLQSFPDTRSQNAAKRYQVLQLLCREMGWRLEEGLFFALEQRSLRHSKLDPKSDRWLSLLYDVFSNYGTNVARALTVLATGIFLFAIVFAVLESPRLCVCPVDTEVIWNGFMRSLRGAFVPFYELREPTKSSAIAVLESLLSIPTIAMILIALRWRFRKGE